MVDKLTLQGEVNLKELNEFFLKLYFLDFTRKYKANGADQFAPLSTKSQIGSPEMGLINAVEKAQITAQTITGL